MARYVDVYDLNNNFRGELCNHIDCDNCTFHRGAYFCRLGDYLLKYETADVAPVIHAHWEKHFKRPGVYEDLYWHCTNCNSRTLEEYAPYWWLYCPHCGAKMDER